MKSYLKITKRQIGYGKISHIIAIAFMVLAAGDVVAQSTKSITDEGTERGPFEKKFRWGPNFNMYWGTVSGDQLATQYFAKPCLGMGLRAEYYFTSFLGAGIGVGYQQRGAGILNPDNTGGAYSHPWVVNNYGTQSDPDSTYLEKLRFNTIEVPVTLLLRLPKDMIKGLRPSAGLGAIYLYNIRTNDIFQSITDGIHKDNFVTDAYIRNDIGIQISLGADIDAGGNGTIFQVHFVYTQGMGNVYTAGQGNGHQVTYGVRLSALF